jgi:hypothetical protein
MRIASVEIFSDKTNAAVLRHPSRAFPGVLIQGDSLYMMCQRADLACKEVGRGSAGYDEMNELRNSLWAYLTHYKASLLEHGMKLPFSDQSSL